MATIVVMDDDDFVRGVLVRVLKMHGYTVLAFPDARPALDTVDFGVQKILNKPFNPLELLDIVQSLV